MDTATLHEDTWRWRDDDGNESSSGATFLELEEVNHTFDAALGELNSNVRLRFAVHTEVALEKDFIVQLETSLNGGTFDIVNLASFNVIISSSANLTDAEDTTEHGVTFVGSGSFHVDNDGVDTGNGIAGSALNDVAAQDFEAFEFCFQLVQADLTDGDVLEFRIIDASGPTKVFESYPPAHAIANIVIPPAVPGETYLPAYIARHRLIPHVTR